MTLFEFYKADKPVEITLKSNIIYDLLKPVEIENPIKGKIINHTIAGDNDPEQESITFIPDSGIYKGKEIDFTEGNIKSIEILNDK